MGWRCPCLLGAHGLGARVAVCRWRRALGREALQGEGRAQRCGDSEGRSHPVELECRTLPEGRAGGEVRKVRGQKC